jgi:UDP-glucuronate 4-epimerase
LLEQHLQRPAQTVLLPMQTGDVYNSLADLSAAQHDFNYCPQVSIAEGIARTVAQTPAWRA